ncbi:MAG TPA: glycosyltransferase family A protein [Roseiflexaceae bacterium]|nr:glycosyltransferase family A protein [Roseiflexaceae bacterium]
MIGPQVSVIIPCYNYARFLPDAVASVLAQSSTAWEVLIVDDGSTDDTLIVAQQLQTVAPIRLLRQPNGGPSAARNTGACHARAPLLLFLDADDMLAPEALQRMVKALHDAPDASFVSGAFQVFGNDNVYWPGLPVDLATLALDNTVLPAALVRRTAWEAVGGFDPAIQLYEDWDFWLRIVVKGGRGIVLPETLLYYRRHGPSLMAQSSTYGWSARAYIISKHQQLYGKQLARWADQYLTAHPLPATYYMHSNETAVEEIMPLLETNPAPEAPPEPSEPIGMQPRGKRRIMRLVPVQLRVRAKQILRRTQLTLKKWSVMAGR